MATITDAHLINDTGSFNARTNVRTYTRTWRITTDAPATSGFVLNNAPVQASVPAGGDPHPDDSDALAVDIEANKLDDTLQVFQYEVEYSTEFEFGSVGSNPLDDAPVVEWSSQEAQEAYFVDQQGDPVVNSIGQPFEQMPQRFAADWELTVTRNVADYDLGLIAALLPSVNGGSLNVSDGFLSWSLPADQALLVEAVPSRRRVRNGVAYYELRMRWKIEPQGWNASERYLDYGTFELKDDNGTNTWVPAIDGHGGEITERFALDGSGGRVEPPGAAAELPFVAYAATNHNQLPVT